MTFRFYGKFSFYNYLIWRFVIYLLFPVLHLQILSVIQQVSSLGSKLI
jgi:hypothetical protein